MDINLVAGYLLAILAGISLGLIGSGGSILTVPILVYILAVEPVLATAYSLFVVGTSALVGGISNAAAKNVDYRAAAIFGIPALLAAYAVRAFIIPAIPEFIVKTDGLAISRGMLLMVLFAIVMLLASFRMIRNSTSDGVAEVGQGNNFLKLTFLGLGTGIVSGAIGAGGGFIIIPALVFFIKMPLKKAVGTSLVIVSVQSLMAFTADAGHRDMDWFFLSLFTLASVIGIFIGIRLSRNISGNKLKPIFGWFLLVMAIYIIIKELLLK